MIGTARKYPKGTPHKHHFVPKSYLAGFCRENSDRFALFDRARGVFRDRQRPAEVAHIRDYYAFPTADGETSFEVERALGDIESKALPVIRKIDEQAAITNEDRQALALYVAFQHTRTPVFQHTVEGMGTHLLRRIAEMAHGRDELNTAGIAAELGDGSKESSEQIAELGRKLGIAINRAASLRMMLSMAPEIAKVLYDMNWLIARRPDDKASFITTDSPFCLVPGPNSVPDPFLGIGIKTPGILKVMPLSQSSVLVMMEPGLGLFSRTLTRDEVRETNHAIAQQCQNFIFSRDLRLVERVVARAGLDKTKWQSRMGFA